MALPVSSFSMSFRDYSGEPSHVRVNIHTINAGNLAATQALLVTLENTIVAATLGQEQRHETVLEKTIVSGALPSSVDAQREKKWLVRYHDANNGKKYQSEIPCADLSTLAPNSDFMDTTNAVFTNLKAAWEAVVLSPDDAGAVVLDSVQFVGRRL